MKKMAVAGIVFANVNDNLLKKITSHRSMASVPFGGRYRLIDFSLSNLVNAGISKVGVITKEKYRSLMDHVSSGIYWDLDRKNGGIYWLPPYLTGGVKRYSGTIDALYGARDYIKRCNSDCIVLCDADVLANIDISAAIKAHAESEADITLVYHKGKLADIDENTSVLTIGKDNSVTKISFDGKPDECINYGIGYTIIGRDLLSKLVSEANENDLVSFYHDVIAKKTKQLKICGFEHKGYVSLLKSTESYYRASMDLLDGEVRNDLFCKERPVLTKTRDDMPTRYGTKSQVKNSFIANGCIINGTVKNSILFRGVTVQKGAVVENCILMQETAVGENCQLDNVIADKNAVIGDDMVLKGTEGKRFYVKKNQII